MSWREDVYKRLRSLPNVLPTHYGGQDLMPLKEAIQILTERLWALEKRINELEERKEHDRERLEGGSGEMTPICPKCGKKLDHLIYREISTYVATLVGDGIFLDQEDREQRYECPFCGEKLFSSHDFRGDFDVDDMAEEFLKGNPEILSQLIQRKGLKEDE
ncbi:hypothetical protein J7L00_03480 [Candidatus Bathyarchaeota archaeon]|nr:hypothetical protein [Candidatus Bathyarchaeota archaeon]